MFVFYLLIISLSFRGSFPLEAEFQKNLHLENIRLRFPKSVILIVAKGMSYDNILEARVKEAKEAGNDNSHALFFEKFLCNGIMKSYDENYIGSSLMSASALFRGTYNLVNSSCERADSYDDVTIISSAQNGNKSTGLVTTMRLTDPLPATLYGIGHGSGVSECPELANANCTDASHILIHGKISSSMDVIFGNGHGILEVDANDLGHKETECHRVDGRNLINEWKSADPKRVYFRSAEEFSNHKVNSGEKYLGTFLDSELNETKELNDVVIKTIHVLKSNINGYFLVVIIDDLDAVKMILTLSKLVRRVKMVISSRDTMLVVTSDYIHPKENCNGEVVEDDSKNNEVSANSETEMKMPMTGEKNTSQWKSNSSSASAKIRVMYPCNHSGSPSKNLHIPFYASRACGSPKEYNEYIKDQANFGYSLMNLGYKWDFSSDSDKDQLVEDYIDWYMDENIPNVACHEHIIIYQLIFFAISHYFFL